MHSLNDVNKSSILYFRQISIHSNERYNQLVSLMSVFLAYMYTEQQPIKKFIKCKTHSDKVLKEHTRLCMKGQCLRLDDF